jgi:hypothetical protein
VAITLPHSEQRFHIIAADAQCTEPITQTLAEGFMSNKPAG